MKKEASGITIDSRALKENTGSLQEFLSETQCALCTQVLSSESDLEIFDCCNAVGHSSCLAKALQPKQMVMAHTKADGQSSMENVDVPPECPHCQKTLLSWTLNRSYVKFLDNMDRELAKEVCRQIETVNANNLVPHRKLRVMNDNLKAGHSTQAYFLAKYGQQLPLETAMRLLSSFPLSYSTAELRCVLELLIHFKPAEIVERAVRCCQPGELSALFLTSKCSTDDPVLNAIVTVFSNNSVELDQIVRIAAILKELAVVTTNANTLGELPVPNDLEIWQKIVGDLSQIVKALDCLLPAVQQAKLSSHLAKFPTKQVVQALLLRAISLTGTYGTPDEFTSLLMNVHDHRVIELATSPDYQTSLFACFPSDEEALSAIMRVFLPRLLSVNVPLDPWRAPGLFLWLNMYLLDLSKINIHAINTFHKLIMRVGSEKQKQYLTRFYTYEEYSLEQSADNPIDYCALLFGIVVNYENEDAVETAEIVAALLSIGRRLLLNSVSRIVLLERLNEIINDIDSKDDLIIELVQGLNLERLYIEAIPKPIPQVESSLPAFLYFFSVTVSETVNETIEIATPPAYTTDMAMVYLHIVNDGLYVSLKQRFEEKPPTEENNQWIKRVKDFLLAIDGDEGLIPIDWMDSSFKDKAAELQRLCDQLPTENVSIMASLTGGFKF